MTAITDTNAAEQVSVPRILAELLMLGQLHKLPDPYAMNATEANGIATINVRSRVAFDGWMAALDCNPDGYVSDQAFEGGRLASAPSITRLGWYVSLVAQYSEVHTELPAKALIALEQIAGAR